MFCLSKVSRLFSGQIPMDGMVGFYSPEKCSFFFNHHRSVFGVELRKTGHPMKKVVTDMQVAVIPNPKASGVCAALPRVCRALEELGAQVLLPGDIHRFPSAGTDELLSRCDVAVALGGDGTIIHAAKRAAICGRPVLGINCGRLGFMAGLEGDELDQLAALIHGNYTIERRMLLDIQLEAGDRVTSFSALNEAVVSRGALSRMIELEVRNQGERVSLYQADGVIVATPTGSTAYSLSAGGPVIDPALRCLLLTPVCPHSLHSRSYIFHEDAVLSVTPHMAGDSQVFLTVDGEQAVPVGAEDRITLSRARAEACLIKIKAQSFYDVLNRKLMDR